MIEMGSDRMIKELAYREPKPPIIKCKVVCCGTCGHRVKRGYTYCKYCGQKQGKLENEGGMKGNGK